MSIRPILTWPDDRLARVCLASDAHGDLSSLVGDLFDTMYAAKGRGLAAPQIGELVRVFVMDAGWKKGAPTPLACIDPVVLDMGADLATGPEMCLSVPGVTALVSRPARVRLGWTGRDGSRRDAWFQGDDAVIAQHEADHLDGRLHFDRLAPAAQSALIEAYVAAQEAAP